MEASELDGSLVQMQSFKISDLYRLLTDQLEYVQSGMMTK